MVCKFSDFATWKTIFWKKWGNNLDFQLMWTAFCSTVLLLLSFLRSAMVFPTITTRAAMKEPQRNTCRRILRSIYSLSTVTVIFSSRFFRPKAPKPNRLTE